MRSQRDWTPETAQLLDIVDEKALLQFLQNNSHIKTMPFDATQMRQALDNLRTSNPFGNVKDSVAWQREIRKDRDLSR